MTDLPTTLNPERSPLTLSLMIHSFRDRGAPTLVHLKRCDAVYAPIHDMPLLITEIFSPNAVLHEFHHVLYIYMNLAPSTWKA
jgi:hypothetical protein